MVGRRSLLSATFAISATLALMLGINIVSAQTRVYHFEREWTQIWINQDGTIDLSYYMSLSLDSGPSISFIQIGQPNSDFDKGEAVDQYGHSLATSDDSSGSDYKVRVTLFEPLTAGQTIAFNLTTNVGRMIFEDAKNPGNVGVQFTPTWWEEAVVSDLRILIVLPQGVTQEEVLTTSVFWNSTQSVEGRLGVYWQKQDLTRNERYAVGVSFPAKYVENYEKAPTGSIAFLQTYGIVIGLSAIAVGVVAFVVIRSRKKPYLAPKISMETLGIKRGLTAVEASYLLGFKSTQIVTEILYSLLKKRAVWTESTNPSLKLRIMAEFKNKTGTEDNPLRYYEIDFLNAVKGDGTLEEEKLAHTIMYLRDTVEEKLRGYNRNDTMDYYKKIVNQAWTQVEQAGTPEVASKAYDEQLLWLLLDPNTRGRTETAFHNRVFEPNPLWFWYWYGYTHYSPNPAVKPNIDVPAQSAKPPAIPGTDFANNIATAMVKTSNNFVLNLEKFANAIVPSQTPKVSHEPAHHKASCVCACHACACACACVSCACACAGGGVG